MFKSYLKIAWRNIIKHRIFTAINLTGLALGMSCCLFIFLWVNDEKGIDNFHRNGKNIYAVYQNIQSNGGITSTYTTPVNYNFNLNPKHFTYPLEHVASSVPGIKHIVFYATG